MRLIDADKLMRFFTVDTANQTYRFGTIKKQIENAETVQAIPIPKDVTNGDIIKAMLNPYKICEYEYSVHVYMTEKDFWKSDYQMNCNARWWNTLYKRGNEND